MDRVLPPAKPTPTRADHRLPLAFGLLIGLLIGVSWLALDRMGRIDDRMNQLVRHEWVKVKLARQALACSAANNRITLSVFLMSDRQQIEPLLVERAQNTRQITQLLGRIEQEVASAQERELLAEVKAAREPYVQSYLKALQLQFQDKRYEAARQAMVARTLPLLIHYHACWNRFVEFQGRQMDAAAQAAEQSYISTWQQTLGLTCLAALGACVIAVFVTRGTAREAAERRRAEAELRQIQDQLEIRVRERTRELEQEIAERKRSEERLRLFRSLMDQSKDAIEVLDPQTGHYLDANEAAWRDLGYSRQELLGLSVLQVDSQIDPEGFARLGQQLRQSEGVTIRSEHRRKDGSVFPVEVNVRRVLLEREYMVAVARNITERTQLEVQLRQAQKLEAVGQLAAGIAHEINTPMQYVGDNTRFLQESFATVAQATVCLRELMAAAEAGRIEPELLERVKETLQASDLEYLLSQIPAALSETLEGVERVTKIVRAMKEFSHPGGKDKALADLNRAIQTTVTVARNEWKYVAEVALDLEPQLPPVPCFLGEFNQVLLNLLVNAAHAIGDVVRQRPDAKGTIRISTRLAGNQAEVRVADTGSGIPEAIRPRVFEPFFTTKEVGKGTGQGLAFVYSSVVKRHGGTVELESEVGRGTTFILRLPLTVGSAGPPPEIQSPEDLLEPTA